MDENGENREPQLGRTIHGEDPARAESPAYLSIRNLFLGIFAVIILGGLVHICLTVAFFTVTGTRPGEKLVTELPEGLFTGQPGLQVAPERDMQILRLTEDARLRGFEIDEQSGRARIPIDAAMDLIAAQGLPVTPANVPTRFAGDSGFAFSPTQAPPGTPLFQGTFPPFPTEAPRTPGPPAGAGQPGAALFQELGCSSCHQQTSTDIAPSLVGLYGEEVPLEGGQTVTADEAYLAESILNPNARIVAGYQPIMPSYENRVSEEELQALVDYIVSLGD